MSSSASRRERAVTAMLVVALVYAATAGFWFAKQNAAWKKAANAYEAARSKYEKECELISREKECEEEYEAERMKMRTFREGRATDTEWVGIIDEIAASNHIQISSLQANAEVVAGEVLELPVEVKSWEGALESLVKFMYEVETTTRGMFDFGYISFQPGKPGYFRGKFTLTCAYVRGNESDGEDAGGDGGTAPEGGEGFADGDVQGGGDGVGQDKEDIR